MLIDGRFLDEIANSYLIVLENSELPSCLSRFHNLSIFTDNFSFKVDDKEYFAWIFGVDKSDEDCIIKPIYETIDIASSVGRCLVLEWKLFSERFEVYGLGDVSSKVEFGVNASEFGECYREEFLNAFDWFYNDERFKDIGDYCMGLVSDWFYKSCGFTRKETEKLMESLFTSEIRIF